MTGGVLVVGAGNSGAEIALELARTRPVWLSGRDVGTVPFDIEGTASRLFLARLVIGFVFHHVITVRSPIGRRIRPRFISRGAPLIRIRPGELEAGGVRRVGRVVGARDGLELTGSDPNERRAARDEPGPGYCDRWATLP